jgi:hypothetical protein
MKTRENGYYWVKDGDEWEVAEWWENGWYFVGQERSFSDNMLDEIDEIKIIRK